MMASPFEGFDPDFAAPADWAAMYRARGLQVIPCYLPNEVATGVSWKRPRLSEWATLQEDLIPDATFDRWYGRGGEYASRDNMGILTGRASGNVFVIDLDDHKGATAGAWWSNLLEQHNHGIEPETWQQRTGGGGRQILLRARPDWHAPTNRTPIGVDIRGQGGFAVMPSSIHESGKRYEWEAGRSPFEIEIETAPEWLLEAIDELVAQYGGDKGGGGAKPSERTASPGADFDSFGNRVDGREEYMTRVVWAAVVDLRRECPILPGETEQRARAEAAYAVYERGVKSRLVGADKTAALDREGRGPAEFWRKWKAAIKQWGSHVAEEAGKARPGGERPGASAGPESATEPGAPDDEPICVYDLKGQPKPREWLVKDWIPLNVVSSIAGDGGVGKTLLAQQLLYAAGVGGKWLGMDVPPVRGLGVFCEDDADELHRRHDDIKADLGHTVDNPFTDTWIWPRVGFDNLLVTFDKDNRPTMSAFFELVMKNVIQKKVGLLVLDTIADLFGGNEIIRAQVNFFIKATCGAFIKKAKDAGFSLTVILLSHPSQAGRSSGSGESGSTAWNNAVRARLYLTRPEDGLAEQRVLTRKKSNYSASGDDVKIDLIWSEGVLKASPTTVDQRVVLKSLETQILAKVSAAWEAGHPYKGKKDHPKFLDRCMAEAFRQRFEMGVIVAALGSLKASESILIDRQGDRRGWRPSSMKNMEQDIEE